MLGRNFAISVVSLLGLGISWAATGADNYLGCQVSWSDTELRVSNTHIERTWKISNGLLTATSFRDLDSGIEWLAKSSDRPAPLPAGTLISESRPVSVSVLKGQQSPVQAPSLTVEIKAVGRECLQYRLQIFPDSRGIAMEFSSTGGPPPAPIVAPKVTADVPTGDEKATPDSAPGDDGNALEDLVLRPVHLRFVQVNFADQTDRHNNLVFEREWQLSSNERDIFVPGNLFYFEDVLTGAGLIFLKEAPLPNSRPVKSDWDMQVSVKARHLRFVAQGYPFITLAYAGGRAGRIAALQNYQRERRVYVPDRDGRFMSNTWGDRSRDARINEGFIMQEVAAGAKLGVDVIQIDDGWQKGHSNNSAKGRGVWSGFWASDAHFWDLDSQRFPGGWDKLMGTIRSHGLKLGLWFAPDSSQEFANWQRDAARILELWRTEGIEYFKFDSINAPTMTAQDNLHQLFRRIQNESQGKIVIDLDVTAGVRPGYFGSLETGPIFVENRYTDYHGYWPHLTLRNLWMLAQYVDPLRLQMEFLNNTRNTNLYPNDPLAPGCYPPDTLFATVMVANPLGWFETSSLPPAYVDSVSALVKVWRQERKRFYSGTITPIGQAPDGVTWTGFASSDKNGKTGYLLIFRELNSSAQWVVDLSPFSHPWQQATVLSGQGSVTINHGQMVVTINQPLQYLWIRVDGQED